MLATSHHSNHWGCTKCTHNRFSALCLWLPRWAGTKRTIHPLTPILIIRHPLLTSSIYCNPWHPPCSTCVLDSPFPQPLQVLFGLLLGLGPCTSYSIHTAVPTIHFIFTPASNSESYSVLVFGGIVCPYRIQIVGSYTSSLLHSTHWMVCWV